MKTRPEVNDCTGECAACGYEFRNDRPPTYHATEAADSPSLCVCDDCTEDAHRVIGFQADSDVIGQDSFDKLKAYVARERVDRWCELHVESLSDVREFFDDLSAFLNWHPDTDFKDYVQLGTEVTPEGPYIRTFDDAQAKLLNTRLQECFRVSSEGRKFDVYDEALQSAQRAGWAPKDEPLKWQHATDDMLSAQIDDRLTITLVHGQGVPEYSKRKINETRKGEVELAIFESHGDVLCASNVFDSVAEAKAAAPEFVAAWRRDCAAEGGVS